MRGESRADFVRCGSTKHPEQQTYDVHLREMKLQYGRVLSAFAQDRLSDETEVQDLCESLLATLFRSFLAMCSAVSSEGRAATEVLANTARQYHEVLGYIRRLRIDLGKRSKELANHDEGSQFLGGRPPVEPLLALETYDADRDKDALSLSWHSTGSKRADRSVATSSPSAKSLWSDTQLPSAAAAVSPTTPAAAPGQPFSSGHFGLPLRPAALCGGNSFCLAASRRPASTYRHSVVSSWPAWP